MLDINTDPNGGNDMKPKSSGNSGNSDRLSTSLFVVGASLPLTVFLFAATPTLIITVDPTFLAFITQLLLLLIFVGALASIIIGVKWLWLIFNDDRDTRRYWHEQHELDLEERRLEIRKRPTKPLPTRTNRSTDAAIPVVMQQRPVTRRPNSYRPDH